MKKHQNKIFWAFILFWICHVTSFSQINSKWDTEEIKKANTVAETSTLNEVEKEAVILLNLARLFPKKFVQLELINYNGPAKFGNYLKDSEYKKSLIKHMNEMQALPALFPNVKMNENAKCFAVESGERGYTGHQRITCEKMNVAECCSYGMETGRDIVLQLLIDHDVPSLGHRNICFNANYSKLGIGVAHHKKWDTCCVIVII